MTGKRGLIFSIAIALGAGAMLGEFCSRSVLCRDLLGVRCGRGHLLAIVKGRGFYESDIDSADRAHLSQLIVGENLAYFARTQVIGKQDIAREFSLLRAQFGNEHAFANAMRASELSGPKLRLKIKRRLQAERWIEEQISGKTTASEEECRVFYETHAERFIIPARWRASHLFLAAPEETLPEVSQEKRSTIESLRTRIARGENLAVLAAEFSEDEATKRRQGDLGVFSEARMPPEFIEHLAAMKIGQLSEVVESLLGYHLVQVAEVKAPEKLRFEDAKSEIVTVLAGAQRRNAVSELISALNRSTYIRTTATDRNL